MPQVRMIGLVLFITAVLLALAAAATKTTHIRIQTLPSSTVNPTLVSPAAPANPGVSLPDTDPRFEPHQPLPVESPVDHQAEQQIQFTSVPVMWPLLGAGCLGMILWFFQPSERNRKQSSSRRRR